MLNFIKRKIQIKYIYWFLVVIYSFWVFFMPSTAMFRDFASQTESNLTTENWFHPNFARDSVVNFFLKLGLADHLIWSFLFSSIFCLGFLFTFIFLGKIVSLIETKSLNTKTNLLLSTLYIFNPYTLERFLMGQYFVLIGHALFLPFCWYFLSFFLRNETISTNGKFTLQEFFQSQSIKSYFQLLFFTTILTYFSTHHGGFALVILGVSSLYKIYQIFKKNHTWQYLIYTCLILFIIGLNLFLLSLKYASPVVEYYDKYISNSEMREDIIQSFSLKTAHSDDILLIQALIGSAGWLSPFIEISHIQSSFGFGQYLLFYFNPILAFVCILSMLYILWQVFKRIWKDKKTQILTIKIGIYAIALIAIILNFGYSIDFFSSINQWFFKLPFSYTYREAGKFYSLFLAMLVIILAMSDTDLPIKLNKYKNSLLIYLTLASLVLFFPLSHNLNYIKIPQIFVETNQICTNQDKILYLPLDAYSLTSYSSEVFILNPSPHLLTCPKLKSSTASLVPADKNKENLTLYTSSQDLEIMNLIKQANANENNTINLLNYLRNKKITMLMLDTYHHIELQYLQKNLDKLDTNLVLQENSIFVYRI